MTEQAARPPLAWGLTAIAVISMAAGGGGALAAGYGSDSLAAAFATLFVVAAALLSVRERLWYAVRQRDGQCDTERNDQRVADAHGVGHAKLDTVDSCDGLDVHDAHIDGH